MMVFLCHIGLSIAPRLPHSGLTRFNSYYNEAGSLGVSLFFVLSGFILTWVAVPGERARTFWRRRLVKIGPMQVVTMAGALLLMATAGIAGIGVTWSNSVPALLFIQPWVPDQNVVLNYGSNTVVWSLACEAFFYSVFPLLYAGLRRVRPERLWPLAGAVVAAVVAVPFVAQLLPASPMMPLSSDSWLRFWFVYYFPPTRLLEFALGVIVCLLVRDGRWIRLRPSVGMLLVVGGFLLGGALPVDFGSVMPSVVPLALLIGSCAATEARTPSRYLGSRPMVRLAEISFAFYMVHFLVVSYGPLGAADFANWSRPLSVFAAVGESVVTLLITVVVAGLLYTLVERPLVRRYGARPRPATVAGTAG